MQRFSLNGKWNLNFKNPGDKVIVSKIDDGKNIWYDAQVPGDVHLDMIEAGLIDNPFFGRNADHCLWMESKDWWYRKSFKVPDSFSDKIIYLRFAGLDTFATVFLNKEIIGQHQNMFTPLEIDVTKYVKMREDNGLLVKLASPIYGVNPDLINEIHNLNVKMRCDEPLTACSRKPAMGYGWDIAPRLLTIGIWKDVELLAFDEARITGVYIHTKEFSKKDATVSFEVEVKKEVEGTADVELEAAIGEQRKSIKIKQKKRKDKYKFEFHIGDPHLWWPNGYGEPNLYRCKVILFKDGAPIDTNESDFGIRMIELVQEPQKNNATSFFFRVNGKDIFIKGFNWTPPDAIFARIDTKRYEELLKLAKECHANMLRVWGGGIYEKDCFYQLCDRLGILIWQDFMTIGLVYPQGNRDFMKNLKEEVESAVKELRNHACIALWCGDNEGDSRLANWKDSPYYFSKITRKLIPAVLQQWDRERPYLPSSPSSPNSEGDPNDRLSGDRHQYMHGADYRHPDFMHNPCCPRFLSETGYLSCPDKEVLRQFLRENEMWPTDNKVWWYHSSDTRFEGSRSRISALHNGIRKNEKPEPKNIDEFIQYTQEVQAEALVEWIYIAAKNPECGGILFWNLCDCWPQISDSVIAYPGKPKLAYQALREAFKKIKR